MGAVAELGKLALAIVLELDPLTARLRGVVGKPGFPRTSLDDIKTQLQQLIGPGLFERPRERLLHVPRYLRAISVRLERMPNGPQKDLAKAEQVLPLWADWLGAHEALRGRVPAAALEEHRWLLEELRVAVFAPELKTAVPVSPQRLTERWRDIMSAGRRG
jgi:ATP-dependent helicase HrpA